MLPYPIQCATSCSTDINISYHLYVHNYKEKYVDELQLKNEYIIYIIYT